MKLVILEVNDKDSDEVIVLSFHGMVRNIGLTALTAHFYSLDKTFDGIRFVARLSNDGIQLKNGQLKWGIKVKQDIPIGFYL